VSLGKGGWSLLLYTDGLIEGRSGAPGGERLGVDGLSELLAARERDQPAALPLWLLSQAEQRNGGPLADDVALLLMTQP
jgi:serine phosphatase RsbU (regulator of sigma subunit)